MIRESLERVAGIVERCLMALLLLILTIMVASICLQVAGRYLFSYAPAWTEELARFSMAWITMLGAAVVLRRDGHIAVTVLVSWLPSGLAWGVSLLRDLLILMMAGALAYYGYGYAVLGGRRASPALEIPMFYPFLAIPVGAVVIGLLLLLKRAGTAPGSDSA